MQLRGLTVLEFKHTHKKVAYALFHHNDQMYEEWNDRGNVRCLTPTSWLAYTLNTDKQLTPSCVCSGYKSMCKVVQCIPLKTMAALVVLEVLLCKWCNSKRACVQRQRGFAGTWWQLAHQPLLRAGGSVAKTGGGAGQVGPTLFGQRVGATMGDTALPGVVAAHVGDSDYPQSKYLFFCVTHNIRAHTI